MIAFSDCKINLGLDIVGRHPDGYHDIETVMYPLPWHDVIEVIPSDGTDSTLTVLGNKVDCPAEKNLVMRAYRAMQQIAGLPPVDIYLEKIVPDGAGLGGGSADAAFTLKLLNEMFDIGLPTDRIAQIAASLGADCPFFIYDRPMLATGIGTDLTPVDIDLSGYTILVAKPTGVSISTKQAYAGVKPRQPKTPVTEIIKRPIAEWQGLLKNDFEPSIFALAPHIARLKAAMISAGALYASMSGSGASVFGIFLTEAMAQTALTTIMADAPDTVAKLFPGRI